MWVLYNSNWFSISLILWILILGQQIVFFLKIEWSFDHRSIESKCCPPILVEKIHSPPCSFSKINDPFIYLEQNTPRHFFLNFTIYETSTSSKKLHRGPLKFVRFWAGAILFLIFYKNFLPKNSGFIKYCWKSGGYN